MSQANPPSSYKILAHHKLHSIHVWGSHCLGRKTYVLDTSENLESINCSKNTLKSPGELSFLWWILKGKSVLLMVYNPSFISHSCTVICVKFNLFLFSTRPVIAWISFSWHAEGLWWLKTCRVASLCLAPFCRNSQRSWQALFRTEFQPIALEDRVLLAKYRVDDLSLFHL